MYHNISYVRALLLFYRLILLLLLLLLCDVLLYIYCTHLREERRRGSIYIYSTVWLKRFTAGELGRLREVLFAWLFSLPRQSSLYIYMILRGVTKAQMSGDVLKGGGGIPRGRNVEWRWRETVIWAIYIYISSILPPLPPPRHCYDTVDVVTLNSHLDSDSF